MILLFLSTRCVQLGLREVGPGVFLDNETESKAKGRMVDETLGEEADKAVTLGAVILRGVETDGNPCKRRDQSRVHL